MADATPATAADTTPPSAVANASQPATSDAKPETGATATDTNDAEKGGDDKVNDDAKVTESSEKAAADADVETPNPKANNRRKSAGALNRKGSKAKLTHKDAKPGDHFLVKLKGFPLWPAIICKDDMLPPALLQNRPVSAARADGTYAEAYADGGKRSHDRTFPVMYLFTNEFGWVANTLLTELTPEKAKDSINDKMRKDLRAAFELAVEHNSIDHYQDILRKFQEEIEAAEAAEAAEEAAKEAARKEAAATPKKSKKTKATEEDTEMVDAEASTKKSKKRKAEEEVSTPQRPDSVKKPKIKLTTNSTPKAATTNGTPKAKEGSAKPAKVKKDVVEKKVVEKPKEAKQTPEQRREKKEKEVSFLRHKLQKGLLTGPPVESEIKGLSGYLGVLENFTGLEASIIRATKINKVLKAILKLESIPQEDEFNFKQRSRTLLEQWNKLLASAAAAAPATGPTNGTNGTVDKKEASAAKKAEVKATSEGAQDTKAEKNGTTTDEAAKKEDKVAAEAPAVTAN